MRTAGTGTSKVVLYFSAAAVLATVCSVVGERPLRMVTIRLYDYLITATARIRYSDATSPRAMLFVYDEQFPAVWEESSGEEVRSVFPRIVERLRSLGAAVVVFDFVFPVNALDPSRPFARSLRSFPAVVAGVPPGESGNGEYERLALELGFASVGSLQFEAPAGIPRYIAMTSPEPISLVAARLYLRNRNAELNDSIPQAGRWISFRRGLDYYHSYSLSALLDEPDDAVGAEERTAFRPETVAGKAVFIGYDLPRVDRVELPNTAGVAVPGVYAHLFAFEDLVTGASLRILSETAEALVVAVALIGTVAVIFHGVNFRGRLRRFVLFLLGWVAFGAGLYFLLFVILPILQVGAGLAILVLLPSTRRARTEPKDVKPSPIS